MNKSSVIKECIIKKSIFDALNYPIHIYAALYEKICYLDDLTAVYRGHEDGNW